MGKIVEQLEKDINKLVGELKSEEQLKEILKRRLTKKEFKYFKLKMEDTSVEDIQKELACDEERFAEIAKQTISKLNQEKLKQELVSK